jgi:hypothetical protein
MERLVGVKVIGRNRGDLAMTFNPVSYFAGIGTVFVAMAVGFGGGLLMTGSVHNPDPPNRVERVASSAPLASPAATPSSTQASIAPAVAPAPAPSSSPAQAPASPQQAVPQQPPSTETVRAANQQAAAPNDLPSVVREANAKPQDQDVDAKKIAEKKQAERRKWAERKRKQQELEAATVEVRKVERGDGPQEVVQKDTVEMPRIEMPRLGFFGQD